MRDTSRTVASAVAVAALTYSMISTILLRPRWFPDTRFYAVRALELAGRDHEEAKAEAGAFLRSRGVTDPIDVVDVPDARLFRPRILYPVLSVPFVLAAGMNGLVVVPFLSMLGFFLVLWRLLSSRGPPWAAALVFVLVVNSGWVTIYSAAALTDGLALALVAAATLGFPTDARPQGRPVLVYVATVAAGLAREVAPYLFLTAIAGWTWARVRRPSTERVWRLALLAAAAATALTLAVATVTGPGRLIHQIEKFARGDSVLETAPRLFRDALVQTGNSILRDDTLFAVLALALAGCLVARRALEFRQVAAAALAAIVFLALNPTSTNFRLQLPVVPFAATAAVVVLDRVRSARGKRAPAATPHAEAENAEARRDARELIG